MVLGRAAQWLFVLIAGGFLMRTTAGFSVPLAFAIFLTVLFAPAGEWLQRRRVPAPVTTALCFLAVLGIIAAFGVLVARSVASVAAKSSTYAQRARTMIDEVSAWSETYLSVDLAEVLTGQELELPPLVRQAMTPVGDVVQVLVGILFTLVFFAFLFHFREDMRARLFEIFVTRSRSPEERRLAIVGAGTTVRRYLWIKFVISLATGLVIGVAAAIMGLDFPLAWALLAVSLNFIPSIGPMLAVLPAALVALVQGGFAFGLLVTAVMAAIHFLSGNVIEPIIVGYRLRLNFLVILLSLFVWGLVWGFAGMVLAVPITACIKVALDYSGRSTALGLLLGAPGERPRPDEPRRSGDRALDPERSGASSPAVGGRGDGVDRAS